MDTRKHDYVVDIAANIMKKFRYYVEAKDSLNEYLTDRLETGTGLFSVVHRSDIVRCQCGTEDFAINLYEEEVEISKEVRILMISLQRLVQKWLCFDVNYDMLLFTKLTQATKDAFILMNTMENIT